MESVTEAPHKVWQSWEGWGGVATWHVTSDQRDNRDIVTSGHPSSGGKCTPVFIVIHAMKGF